MSRRGGQGEVILVVKLGPIFLEIPTITCCFKRIMKAKRYGSSISGMLYWYIRILKNDKAKKL